MLLPPGPSQQAIPASIYNVAAQFLATEEGIDDHPGYARTHLAGGFWLTLRAARLSSGHQPGAPAAGGGTIAVTIEEASAADRLDLFGRAFALSTRERELLSLLATGSDTRAMARQMSLSEHGPGPSQINLHQDRRPRPGHRPLACPGNGAAAG